MRESWWVVGSGGDCGNFKPYKEEIPGSCYSTSNNFYNVEILGPGNWKNVDWIMVKALAFLPFCPQTKQAYAKWKQSFYLHTTS